MTEITLQVFLVVLQSLHCQGSTCVTQTLDAQSMPNVNTCFAVASILNQSGELKQDAVAACHIVPTENETQEKPKPKTKGLNT